MLAGININIDPPSVGDTLSGQQAHVSCVLEVISVIALPSRMIITDSHL